MHEPIIQVEGLSRHFGQRTALDDVTLLLPRGKVYGLVGANGAGKTTIIRHLLGLLRAERGTVRVFGMDPVAEPVAVLSRVGYLSEENDLPAWMRVGELIRYTRATRVGSWEPTAEALTPPKSCGSSLSRGDAAASEGRAASDGFAATRAIENSAARARSGTRSGPLPSCG